jgi:23S rRNA (pseudouridine1915-N3)-methyltransferase
MRIHLIAMGTRMDDWVNQGFANYQKRMPAEFSLRLLEIPLQKRAKNADLSRIVEKEGEKMLQSLPTNATVCSLDVNGRAYSTEELSAQLQRWRDSGQDLALMVGGPEGLSAACRNQASQSWSLSALTLPHPLVRIIVAEQLYRAYSILANHPYHRA